MPLVVPWFLGDAAVAVVAQPCNASGTSPSLLLHLLLLLLLLLLVGASRPLLQGLFPPPPPSPPPPPPPPPPFSFAKLLRYFVSGEGGSDCGRNESHGVGRRVLFHLSDLTSLGFTFEMEFR